MNKKTSSIYNELQNEISRKTASLSPGDYKEVLDELAAHIECLIDCWKEENE